MVSVYVVVSQHIKWGNGYYILFVSIRVGFSIHYEGSHKVFWEKDWCFEALDLYANTYKKKSMSSGNS